MKRVSVMIAVMLLAVPASVAAQAVAARAGYYPIEEMGIFAAGDLEVDVDLSGPMLQAAAVAMQEEEDDDANLAELVSGLDRVRVQVGEPSGIDPSTIAARFDTAVTTLKSSGWNQILRVVDGDEQVYLFARNSDDRIVGLTALVNDANEEVVLVNIVGDIDPVLLGRALAKADGLRNLEVLMEAGE